MRKELKLLIPKEQNPYYKNNPQYFDELLELVQTYPLSFQNKLRGTGIYFNQATYKGIIRKYQKYNKNKDKTKLLAWINNNLPKLTDSIYNIATKCYWILNGLIDFPKCPICGKYDNYIGKNINLFRGYSYHCSYDCANHDENTMLKQKRTKLNKYGDETYNNPKKISDTYWAKPDEERKKMACAISYRVLNKSPEEKKQIREKREATSLRLYGVAICCNSEKAYETCIKNYGSPHFGGSDAHKKLLKDPTFICKIVAKQHESKRKNKTFKISYKETLAFTQLQLVFPDLIRQFKSDKYPFLCDFYSTSFDLYIEFNGTWTHGGHEFDPNNLNDIQKLNIWSEKAKTSKYYSNAIQTWTIRDKEKFETARRNNLNYIVFWNINEVEKYVSEFLSKFVSI